MVGVRTFVLLHPYGTPDGYKQVYAGRDPRRVTQAHDGMVRAGWQGSVHLIRAGTFDEAVRRLHERLHR